MSIETLPLQLGPDANGMLLNPDEFDAAEFERGWSYELIRGSERLQDRSSNAIPELVRIEPGGCR